eukprot:11159353-Alexandrium_andersonii.AAC.1
MQTVPGCCLAGRLPPPGPPRLAPPVTPRLAPPSGRTGRHRSWGLGGVAPEAPVRRPRGGGSPPGKLGKPQQLLGPPALPSNFK